MHSARIVQKTADVVSKSVQQMIFQRADCRTQQSIKVLVSLSVGSKDSALYGDLSRRAKKDFSHDGTTIGIVNCRDSAYFSVFCAYQIL